MPERFRVFIMLEDPTARELVTAALASSEFSLVKASRGQRGLDELVRGDFHLAFLDLPRHSMKDDRVFRALSLASPPTPAIVVADDDNEHNAIGAVEQGAYDYLLTSMSPERVRVTASRAITHRRTGGELQRTRSILRQENLGPLAPGGSPAMLQVMSQAELAGGTDGNVIIEGEPGTGKRHAARTIHYLSRRQEGPLVELSCNLVPESLVESDFFGRETGAFTRDSGVRPGKLEQAHGGTLYLEDIDRLHKGLQRRLLHTLLTGEVERVGGTSVGRADLRVVASSTRSLESEVYAGNFLKDLYDALGSVRIRIPPLRARRDEIPILLEKFLKEQAGRLRHEPPVPDKAAMSRMLQYVWPGNLDELRALAEALARLDSKRPFTVDDLPERIRLIKEPALDSSDLSQTISSLPLPEEGAMLPALVDRLERTLIIKALDRAGGVQKEAARLLGLKRTTLIEKMKKKGIA